jgi:hypothetical protein
MKANQGLVMCRPEPNIWLLQSLVVTSNLVPLDTLQTGFNTKMLNTFKRALSWAFLLIDSVQPRAEHMVLS